MSELWDGLYVAQKIPLVMCGLALLAAVAVEILRKTLRA
jgi:hypothetical protein